MKLTLMKRALSLLLAFAITLSITGCGTTPPTTNTPASAVASSSQPLDVAPAPAKEILWDLSTVYKDKEAFESDVSNLLAQIEIAAAMNGKLTTAKSIADYYKIFDQIIGLSARLSNYSDLQVLSDQSDNDAKELKGRADSLNAKYEEKLAFALPEIFKNSKEILDQAAKEESMKPYLLMYNRDRAQSQHTLSEREEQLCQPITQLGKGAANLYSTLTEGDITFPTIKFPDGVERKADEVNYYATFDTSFPQEFRIKYYNTMMQPYRELRNTLAQNMNNYYTALSADASAHEYDSALEADLAPNDIPLAVHDNILKSVKQALPPLARYFDLIKKTLNVETLHRFETNTAIAKDPKKVYSYEESQKLIKEALSVLGTDYASKLDKMFSSNTIDVYPKENKNSGALAQPVPDSTPFVQLNFLDNFSSCSTLAHEIGHATHMLYSQTQDSYYTQNANALISEVASTLNELLLSDYLIKNATSTEEKQFFAAQQIALLYQNYYTQLSFANFQQAASQEVENGGVLTADKLDALWLKAAKECYGLDYENIPVHADGWMRIPHFYFGFYVYQYAVGIASACNIADRIQSGDEAAVNDYIAYLKSGDSKSTIDTLKIADVDVSDSNYISAFATRFERLVKEFEDTNTSK